MAVGAVLLGMLSGVYVAYAFVRAAMSVMQARYKEGGNLEWRQAYMIARPWFGRAAVGMGAFLAFLLLAVLLS